MKIHRFYISPEIDLKHDFWIQDKLVLHQWNKVLRFRAGQEVVLFDGIQHDRLYKIIELTDKEAHLELVTEFERKLPKKQIYLLWSLLKKDKNDWVLQKCTELGVSHFIPLISDRCERTDLSQNKLERWNKIVVEASEQCGRSDIPNIREPMHISTAIEELKDKVILRVCQQGEETQNSPLTTQNSLGVLIGPEGGWSDAEKQLFRKLDIEHLSLHNFTLRAETATVAAVTKLIQ